MGQPDLVSQYMTGATRRSMEVLLAGERTLLQLHRALCDVLIHAMADAQVRCSRRESSWSS